MPIKFFKWGSTYPALPKKCLSHVHKQIKKNMVFDQWGVFDNEKKKVSYKRDVDTRSHTHTHPCKDNFNMLQKEHSGAIECMKILLGLNNKHLGLC